MSSYTIVGVRLCMYVLFVQFLQLQTCRVQENNKKKIQKDFKEDVKKILHCTSPEIAISSIVSDDDVSDMEYEDGPST